MKYEVRGADYDLIQSILINIEIVLSIIKNNKIPKKNRSQNQELELEKLDKKQKIRNQKLPLNELRQKNVKKN